MAGLRCAFTQNPTLTASVTDALLTISAPANQRVHVGEIGVSFNSVTATDQVILVEVCRITSVGGGSAGTAIKLNASDDETPQASVLQSGTEGSGATVLHREYVPADKGAFTWGAGNVGPFVLKGGDILELRYTTGTLAGTTKAAAHIKWEE